MANVSFDSAFMKQIMPSTLLPLEYSSEFYAVHDEDSRPIIFSVGSAGTLFILRPQGVNGCHSLLNLNKLFGIESAVVTHLSVLQGTDSKIYLTFAAQGAKVGAPSSIYIVHPKMPAEWVAVDTSSKLGEWLIPDKSTFKCTVERLYTAAAGKKYPTVCVVYSRTDGTHTDARCLDISDSQWDFADVFTMPVNIESIIDICAGTLKADYSGLFCLYRQQDQTYLSFVSFISKFNSIFATSLRPPPGARSLATFVNYQGFTDLLVGGDAITHYTAQNALHSDTPTTPDRYTVVVDGPSLGGVKELFIAQASSLLTVYCRNSGDTVLYQQLQDLGDSKVDAQGPLTPLLRREEGGGHLSVLLDHTTRSQKLFSVAADNSLTMLEQSGDTQLWQRIHVLVPSTAGKNTDIVSFTTHISLKDATGAGLPNTTVLLSSSAAADVGHNGRVLSVTSAGTPVTTDLSGDITLIHNVSTLSTVTFTLKDVAGHSVLGKTYIVNPAKNAQSILSSTQDLRAVRLRNGRALIDKEKVRSRDLDPAMQAMKQLSDSLTSMPPDGSDQPASLMFSLSDVGWALWHWVTNPLDLQALEKFVVEGGKFIIHIAGKVYEFLLKGLSYVWKAIHFVLQDVLHIPIDDIIEWLGFIFEWDDIKETHNMIVAMANASIDCAVDRVDGFKTTVNAWFDGADKWLSQLVDIPQEIRDTQLSGKTASSQVAGNEQYSNAQSAPGVNWSSYQLKHGGVGNSLKGLDSGLLPTGDSLVSFWSKIRPTLEQLGKTIQDAFADIIAIFNDHRQLSLGQMLEKFGVDLLRNILKIIRTIADGIIDLVADFITLAQKLMNTVIDIPLLSPLYKWMSGNDLTALDAMSLLIAIPTTVLFKIITGKKPSDSLGDLSQFLQDHSAVKVRSRSSSRERPMRAVGFQLTESNTGEGSGEARALGISSETITKVKLVAKRLVAIAGPVTSIVKLILAVDDWYTPDNGVPLDKLAGGLHWGWKVAGDVIVAAITFPYEEIPGHSDLRLCRELSWGLDCITIPARAANVRVRGLVALAAGCFKLVPEGVSIVMAIDAAKEVKISGDLPSKLEWVDVTDRILSSALVAAGGVCMIINEPEPISATVASLLGLTAIGCQSVKAWEAGAHFEDFPALSQGSFVGGT
ncbi:Vegetative incompatibility protein HET-E-1-like protein 20 [Mycena sanguinolenta]|uniref:Vegetative incompatibility protein HET-E-1-like protein 20 n=1 Tax=Mycena sanguinolenta TaxID=230812 RepID=A0A8H6XNV4_9AGAR|nr:Vegetative incompatibility protein HET-E-1-like protein 20 [Mycena sanguinolenta]